MKSSRNIELILQRRSLVDFIKALGNHVDPKEWSEVGGVYDLCRRIFAICTPKVVFDIGSGKRPTFAVLMALNYKVKVAAIDPQLDTELASEVRGYSPFKYELKQFLSHEEAAGFLTDELTLIVGNHSHVSKREIMMLTQHLKDWIYVTVPCCVDNKLSNNTAISYKDIHMHTDKNDVYIYASNTKCLESMLSGKKLK